MPELAAAKVANVRRAVKQPRDQSLGYLLGWAVIGVVMAYEVISDWSKRVFSRGQQSIQKLRAS